MSSAVNEEWDCSEKVKSFLERVPGNPLRGLEAADKAWARLQSESFTTPPKNKAVVEKKGEKLLEKGERPVWDVVVTGGTLGIFSAAALAVKGHKVLVVEQGKLVGRTQEWNISRKELEALVETGVLTQAQMDQCIVTEYSPQRVGFNSDDETYELDTINGVLNLGVDPLTLIELVKQSFLAAGGELKELTAFNDVTVYDDAVAVRVKAKEGGKTEAMGAGGAAAFQEEEGKEAGEEVLTGRVMLDAMGNFSPVMRQARGYRRPEGVCMVVGTCARGDWVDNSYGDLIYSFTPIMNDKQYFWEAFPSKDLHGSQQESRTTYMFTYMDSDARRPSMASMFEDYLDLLPKYPGAKGPNGETPNVDKMQVSRALFGMFPSYTDSPLPLAFDRILHVGDSSGLQSPLSFGGFGSLLRHLERVTGAVDEALQADLLARQDLAAVQPYLPSLSTMWLFQKAMSLNVGKPVADKDIITKVLRSNFKTMDKLGKGVMMPFLQDVIQVGGLFSTIAGMSVYDPLLVPPLLLWVGPGPVIGWSKHFALLGLYSLCNVALSPFLSSPEYQESLSPRDRFLLRRRLEAWKYGSGGDY